MKKSEQENKKGKVRQKRTNDRERGVKEKKHREKQNRKCKK